MPPNYFFLVLYQLGNPERGREDRFSLVIAENHSWIVLNGTAVFDWNLSHQPRRDAFKTRPPFGAWV